MAKVESMTAEEYDVQLEESGEEVVASPRQGRRKDPPPSHPRLQQVLKQAKKDATRDFDAGQKEKKDKPNKTLSKRQRSNIRSAMICRAAKNLYVKLLEQHIVEEEQWQLEITKQLFEQNERNCMLRERIRVLEAEKKPSEESWLRNEGKKFDMGGFRDEDLDGATPDRSLDLVFEQMEMDSCYSDEGSMLDGFSESEGELERCKSGDAGGSPVTVFDTAPMVPRRDLLSSSVSEAVRAI